MSDEEDDYPDVARIMAGALASDYTVLEFDSTNDDGQMVRDITEHVEELEEQVNESG